MSDYADNFDAYQQFTHSRCGVHYDN